jgi:hypothetical protein
MDKPNWMSNLIEEKREPAPKVVARTPFRPTHEAIAKRAYELYEDSGCPAGRDVEFWLAAERELITER